MSSSSTALTTDSPYTMPRVWFITGASSGFGYLVTQQALKAGDNVVATLRNPSALTALTALYPPSQLLALPLDVTDPSSITAAFQHARATFGRVDVVFNNAGFYVVSEAEGISDVRARQAFEVLFWGAAAVSREAVAFFRDVNDPRGGRLLQMSSRTALEGPACSVHYAAAKAALECLSEGYAAELDPKWNIKITIVEPGLFRTPATSNCIIEPVHPAYTDPALPTMKYRSLYPGVERIFTGDAEKLAQAMLRLVELDDPPLRLPLHQIALDTLKRKGASLIKAADDWEGWSDDIYLSQ
ncbi:hypothetical protein SERLA73DRAFT_74131 [Serpula lacrymans var. lacrymans S7.3]|uniref:NAD(P)-binding protein n=2 Tax=Serpula lacrymans var. lacrymans TaxID=341189 RepID=F8Q0Q0_SERL3|nr:uncharacterized protein SERLADRAFT_408851 [Serpula lacrymans var. lacrymans S7.9]EGN97879.1 hypothetical protein SERLA73DRAFT_74131 [Serpula lacrymans var. lacrymans S7.3]EGO23458.1 hypothetical protein SERLADRAFT_408851 [Serpula lacrymans var. lacrymans S7.9]